MKEPSHLSIHPFAQIPTYEEADLTLFESGAIVLHIAERHAGLLPEETNARARAITWMFAALNTVEPAILELATARLVEGNKPWSEERRPLVEDRVRNRLGQLSARLGDADWLDGAFSAGDLIMVSVLLRLKSSGLLTEFPNLAGFVSRGEARPAYKRAFDAQLAAFSAASASVKKHSDNPQRVTGSRDSPGMGAANMTWKPEGYCSVSPYLLCPDPQKTIDFLLAVFGASILRRYEHRDGSLKHVEVKVDDSVIMLGGARTGVPAEQPHLHVYVRDVDESYRRALDYGAEAVQAPVCRGDDDKRGGVRDANGVTWWLATQGAR